MVIYQFVNAEGTTVRRAAEGQTTFIPWGEEGPIGGGEAWREWEDAGRPTPAPMPAPQAPARFYNGPDIAAAVDRWGATGDAALDALSSREWFALSAGVAADHPALAAILAAAGKTLADLDP